MKRKFKPNMHHAQQRALERFGVVLTKDDLKRLRDDIQGLRSEPIRRCSNRVTWHRVTLPGDILAVAVYDKKRKTIVTLMEDRKRIYLTFKKSLDRVCGNCDNGSMGTVKAINK